MILTVIVSLSYSPTLQQAAMPYAKMYPMYIKHCAPKMKAKLMEHVNKDFEGDESMKNGWATTVFIESCFGVAGS